MDGYMVRSWLPGEDPIDARHWRFITDREDAKKAIREAIAAGKYVNVQVSVTTFDNAITESRSKPFTVGDDVRGWLATMVEDYNAKYRSHHAVKEAQPQKGASEPPRSDRSAGPGSPPATPSAAVEGPPQAFPEQAPD